MLLARDVMATAPQLRGDLPASATESPLGRFRSRGFFFGRQRVVENAYGIFDLDSGNGLSSALTAWMSTGSGMN